MHLLYVLYSASINHVELQYSFIIIIVIIIIRLNQRRERIFSQLSSVLRSEWNLNNGSQGTII